MTRVICVLLLCLFLGAHLSASERHVRKQRSRRSEFQFRESRGDSDSNTNTTGTVEASNTTATTTPTTTTTTTVAQPQATPTPFATPAPVTADPQRACAARCANGLCIGGSCYCYEGYGGENCTDRTCVNGCSASGRCNTTTGICECNPGFFGLACDARGCQHNCYEQGYCHDQTCVCYTGYEGLYCENEVGCPNHCNGHGTCRGGACFCAPGFTGAACDQRVCRDNCNGHGTCNPTDGTCSCEPKYFGTACELRRCPNDCSGRGTCNTTTGVCECDKGFYGNNCAPENCLLDCSGHGVCRQNLSAPINSNTTKAYCECSLGYAGEGCEKEVCPNNCNNNTGRGECKPEGCECKPEYTGDGCSVRQCPYGCNGPDHGVCDNSTYQCNCINGWTGLGCRERVCPQACNFRGVCHNGTCECGDWWTGKRCEIAKCMTDDSGRPCAGHGRCVLPPSSSPGQQLNAALEASTQPSQQYKAITNQFHAEPDRARCICDEGWGGPGCSLRKCLNDCSGRGICTNGVCFCQKGYYGDDCAQAQSVSSQSASQNSDSFLECKQRCVHGKCLLAPEAVDANGTQTESSEYQCFCEDQWAGRNCSINLSRCPPSCLGSDGLCIKDCATFAPCPTLGGLPCGGKDRGVCHADGSCACKYPFGGPDCGTAPCQPQCKHGMCNTRTRKCLCYAGWGGRACDRKL